MIQTPSRSHNAAKYGIRRFNSMFVSGPMRNYNGEPTFFFCGLYTPLLMLWWLKRLTHWRHTYIWASHQHACGCPTCKPEKRKYQGNGWQGKPIQERRLAVNLATKDEN